jgi:hypothetical protein
MPDMAGLGGGLGGLGGAGFGGSLGFASTQIDLFGLKSRGEKIVFLLDSDNSMLADAIGGIPAYTIIKKELVKIVDAMPPTALFNVLVFDRSNCRALSPDMLPATDANLERFKKWIMPLNAQKNKYGLSTLGSPGTTIEFEPFPTVYNSRNNWVAGLGYAARKGADVVYLLGNSQDMPNIYSKYYRDAKRGELLPHEHGWPPELPNVITDYEPCGGRQEWNQTVARARQLHRKFNQDRLARGLPVRVNPSMVPMDIWLVSTSLPDEKRPEVERPRVGKEHNYTADDLEVYIGSVSRKYSSSGPAASLGLATKSFTFNVVHFVTQGQMTNPSFRLERLSELVDKLGGEYVKIAGDKAIQ